MSLHHYCKYLQHFILRYFQIQTIVLSQRLGYVLIDRTPPHITGLEAQQQRLASSGLSSLHTRIAQAYLKSANTEDEEYDANTHLPASIDNGSSALFFWIHFDEQEQTNQFCFEKFVFLSYKQQSKKTKVEKCFRPGQVFKLPTSGGLVHGVPMESQ